MINWWIVSWLQCLALAKLAPLANKQLACQQGPDNRCMFCIFLLIINNPHINNNCDDTCIIHLSSWYVTAVVFLILWEWCWGCPGHFYAIFIGPRSEHSLLVSLTYWLTASLTDLLKNRWIDLNMRSMQTMQTIQTMQTTKPNLQNLTYQTNPTKPNLPNQTYQTKPTKPKLLVKAVNTWVCSAFGNVSQYNY